MKLFLGSIFLMVGISQSSLADGSLIVPMRGHAEYYPCSGPMSTDPVSYDYKLDLPVVEGHWHYTYDHTDVTISNCIVTVKVEKQTSTGSCHSAGKSWSNWGYASGSARIPGCQ